MKYTEMTLNEINKIVDRGGDALIKLNQMVADHLDILKLSEKARNIIATTDINIMAAVFGGCFTSEDVEAVVKEYEE